jgi:hypothetical protein
MIKLSSYYLTVFRVPLQDLFKRHFKGFLALGRGKYRVGGKSPNLTKINTVSGAF